jgi:poly-gamma-glutamate capsule biosynthesis protein CapA/YwtB (metallophosphatase superfamily)
LVKLSAVGVFEVLLVLGCGLAVGVQSGFAQSCASSAVPPSANAVTIKAVGDIVLGSDWPENRYPADFETFATNRLVAVLGNADVIFGNFEGALTTHRVANKVPKPGAVFAFRMPPHFANVLKDAGFGVAHISNNHTYDFGETGFLDTLSNFTAANILTIGDRDQVAVQTVNGIALAWVGFSYSTRHNSMHDLEKLAQLVSDARSRAKLVIVSIQAGAEGSDALKVLNRDEMFLGENRGNVFAFARRAVDLGADLVLGHGPHVVRGMEIYQGKLIAYSLGNFVGYGALSIKRAAALSTVLRVTLSEAGQLLGFDVLPLRFDEEKFPATDPDELTCHLINDLSSQSPLNSSIRLSVTEDASAKYREWLGEAGLLKTLGK